MNQADRIRQYILQYHIAPARAKGLKEVTVRAGDVHQDMGLSSRMPAVCSALDGQKLCDLAAVSRKHRRGPPQGANVFVTFALENAAPALSEYRPAPASTPAKGVATPHIDPKTSLVLVSCVKSKLPRSAPARDLYTSMLFTGARAFARASGAPWYILSAKYGLVGPDEVIAPYDYTLNRLDTAARRAWAENVLQALLPRIRNCRQVVFLAGLRYREFLVGPLEQRGLDVLVPMAGLRFGEQLAWLAERT
jgi:hypothetical protein